MDTAIPYEASGRTRQKQRTREALISAARALIAAGSTPTVEEAAAAASISRTTAYRYFQNQRDLLIAAHPEIEAASLIGSQPPDNIRERLDLAVDTLLRLTLEMEPALRTMLRLSLEADGAHREQLLLRRGRAIGWLEDALMPLRGRVPEDELKRLVYAIRASAGVEALVWLCDVAGLSRNEAAQVMKWSVHQLLRGVLADTELSSSPVQKRK